MKLQIINRLSLHSQNNLDQMITVRRDPQPSVSTSITQYAEETFQPNYYSIAGHEEVDFKQKVLQHSSFAGSQQQYKSFFNNFDRSCTIKYEQKDKIQPNHRRKLQNQLRLILIDKQNLKRSTHKDQIVKYSKQKDQKVTSPLQSKNFYLGQNRHKDKIRKISSLICIKTEQPELSRKPGFILKKNSSLIKRESTQQVTFFEDAISNKENVNSNHQPISKQGGSNVDRQISQSKDRIAQIRKQLNQIYEMRRQPNSFKLKLF